MRLPSSTVLLLTGRPGVGKTTTIRKVAEALPHERLGGFYTEEIREHGKRRGFRAVTFDGWTRVIADVGQPGPAKVGRYGVDVTAIDVLVERSLAASSVGETTAAADINRGASVVTCGAWRRIIDDVDSPGLDGDTREPRRPIADVAIMHSGWLKAEAKESKKSALSGLARLRLPSLILLILTGRSGAGKITVIRKMAGVPQRKRLARRLLTEEVASTSGVVASTP